MPVTQELLRVIKTINEYLTQNNRLSVSVKETLSLLEKKDIVITEKTFRQYLRKDWKGYINHRQTGTKTNDYQMYHTNLQALSRTP
jgi:hypothetical protein